MSWHDTFSRCRTTFSHGKGDREFAYVCVTFVPSDKIGRAHHKFSEECKLYAPVSSIKQRTLCDRVADRSALGGDAILSETIL